MRGPRLIAAGDRAVALWSGIEAGAEPASARRIFVSERAGDGSWSAPRALSDATRDADNGAALPDLVGNERGDLLAIWNSGIWNAQGTNLGSAFAPAGGPFGTAQVAAGEPGSVEAMPVAVDDAGRAIVLRAAGGQAARVALLAREPGACFVEHSTLTSPGTPGSPAAVALRGDGSGLVVWTESPASVRAADIGHDPATPAAPCPSPAGPQPRAAPGDPAVAPPEVKLGRVPARVSRRSLLRSGLRVSITPTRPSTLEVALVGERRGRRPSPPLVIAHRRLGRVAKRTTVRLKVRRRLLALAAPGRKLTLAVAARDGGAVGSATRRLRLAR